MNQPLGSKKTSTLTNFKFESRALIKNSVQAYGRPTSLNITK